MTVTVQELRAPTDEPQVLVWLKSPLAAIEVIVIEASPPLLIVTGLLAGTCKTSFENDTGEGDSTGHAAGVMKKTVMAQTDAPAPGRVVIPSASRIVLRAFSCL